jgi:carbon storage regulator
MLVLSRKVSESVTLTIQGVEVVVTILRVNGNVVRVGVEAPQEVFIHRTELPPISGQ